MAREEGAEEAEEDGDEPDGDGHYLRLGVGPAELCEDGGGEGCD